jgi:hypothetical protein
MLNSRLRKLSVAKICRRSSGQLQLLLNILAKRLRCVDDRQPLR